MLVGFLELCSQDSEEDLESFAYHKNIGIFLAVQWLRLCASTEGGTGSVSGLGSHGL